MLTNRQVVQAEKAVASYISRRSDTVQSCSKFFDPTGNRIDPALALNGTTNMEGNLDVGGNKVEKYISSY